VCKRGGRPQDVKIDVKINVKNDGLFFSPSARQLQMTAKIAEHYVQIVALQSRYTTSFKW
jgi:hypothetical protein